MMVEFTLMGVGRIGTYVATSFQEYTPCSIIVCFVFRAISDMGTAVAGGTWAMIAIERLIATIRIRTYERTSSKLGIQLGVSSVRGCYPFGVLSSKSLP